MACGGCSCEAAVGATASEAYLEGEPVREARELVAELCRHFYAPGWVTGTGGSITVKVHDPDVPLADRLIVMSPSGKQCFIPTSGPPDRRPDGHMFPIQN